METLNTTTTAGFSRAHWNSRHSVSSATSSEDFKIDSPTMTTVQAESDVLVNILLMLQKIDTKIESQKQRLEILETTSPTGSHDTTLFDISPISRQLSIKKAIAIDSVVPDGDYFKDQEVENTNMYARSIMRMRLVLEDALAFADAEPRLSLVDPAVVGAGDASSLSDSEVLDSDKEELAAAADDTNVVLDPQPKEADLYSLSAYTEDLLSSRMNLNDYTATGTWNESLGLDDKIRPATPSSHQHSAVTRSGALDDASTRPKESDESNEQLRAPRWIWMNVNEQRTSEKYKSVEMLFHAWHNFMQCFAVNPTKDIRLAKKMRHGELGVLKSRYRSVNLIQRIVDKMRSSLQREWVEERERMKMLR